MSKTFRLPPGQSFDIFISYRRDDARGFAGRLADKLQSHFGKENVFFDTSSTDPGAKYPNDIRERLDSCDVLIAVIGNQWSRLKDGKERRLDNPRDWVRREIATALRRDILVIPVLVDGAKMPALKELPKELSGLIERTRQDLRETSWAEDVRRLIKTVANGIRKKTEKKGIELINSIYQLRAQPTVLVLGAHADDIELGCGATLLYLKRNCSARIICRVFTPFIYVKGKRRDRLEEMKRAAKMLNVEFDCFTYEDRDLPNQWHSVQREIASLREKYKPDLILVPSLQDTHQDHIVVAQGALREFRHGQALWHYEIKQYGQDRFDPNVFINVSTPSGSRSQAYGQFRKRHGGVDTLAHLKTYILQECMKSQALRPEFNTELLLGIMRLRGIQSSPYVEYAEAFEARVLINGGKVK